MKKIICLVIVVSFFQNLFAQNIGIGTNSPAFKLDVNGRMRIKTSTLNSLSATPGIWFDDYRDGNNRMFLGMQDSLRIGFYGSGTGGLGWQFNFNAKTGYVGIGRTAASSRLEIDDPNGADISLYNNNVYRGRISATNNLEICGPLGSPCIPTPCPAGDIILQPAPAGYVNTSGNVGIGTLIPKARLHVDNNVMIGSGDPATGFALSVNGKVVAQELKIQMAANWPDYVFAKDYKLPSIDYVKDFIQQHNHLPNIPAASEVESNGLMVGDMQKRMMEKIEELSLYIVQLNERIKQLESKQDRSSKN